MTLFPIKKSFHFEWVCSLSPSFSSPLFIMLNRNCTIPFGVKHCNLGFLVGRTRNTYILDLNKLLEFCRKSFMLCKEAIFSPCLHFFNMTALIHLLIFNLFLIENLKRTVQLSKPLLTSHLLELKGEVNCLLGYMWLRSL